MIWTIWTLAIVVLGIGGCIGYKIITTEKGDVGSGAVAAFVGAITGLTTTATVGYRKKEPYETPGGS